MYIIILSILNYVFDSYGPYSASAPAGVITARNTVGAGFPIFRQEDIREAGTRVGELVVGVAGNPLIPIPFVFYYDCTGIMLRSPWAREHFDQDEDMPH